MRSGGDGMIITIDGLDGTGKSTLAKRLSEELGYEYVDKPIYELFNVKGDNNYLYKEISHIQRLVYDETDSDVLKSYFTGLSLLYVKECMSDRNLIIDRGLLSAVAFNGDEKSKPVFETLLKLGVFFDASILVTASKEERIRRMMLRNPNDADLQVSKVLNLNHDRIFAFLAEHPQLPCKVINTDNLNPDQVFEEAMEYINSLKENNRQLTKKMTI